MEQIYVKNLFNKIAKRYDLLNHLLSFGIDKYWRWRAVKLISKNNPKLILDLATGTGDFAIALNKINPEKIIGVDLSENMIECGIQKIKKLQLSNKIIFETGHAEKLRFDDNYFDAITVGFGVRNYENLNLGLKEMFRVLKNGGVTAILEFSKPKNFPFKQIYFFYFRNILPLVGRIISKDSVAYQYLPDTVLNFPEGEDFIKHLKSVGFTRIKEKRLTFGICTIYLGFKD